mgnify:CR=1 FL=1
MQHNQRRSTRRPLDSIDVQEIPIRRLPSLPPKWHMRGRTEQCSPQGLRVSPTTPPCWSKRCDHAIIIKKRRRAKTERLRYPYNRLPYIALRRKLPSASREPTCLSLWELIPIVTPYPTLDKVAPPREVFRTARSLGMSAGSRHGFNRRASRLCVRFVQFLSKVYFVTLFTINGYTLS